MGELVCCAECEGWGITSYEKDGSPNACATCGGRGEVERLPPSEPVYGLTRCQKAMKDVLRLAVETKNSNNAETRELAELVVKLFEEFNLTEEEE